MTLEQIGPLDHIFWGAYELDTKDANGSNSFSHKKTATKERFQLSKTTRTTKKTK